jgi:hypothetical protein
MDDLIHVSKGKVYLYIEFIVEKNSTWWIGWEAQWYLCMRLSLHCRTILDIQPFHSFRYMLRISFWRDGLGSHVVYLKGLHVACICLGDVKGTCNYEGDKE